MLRTAHGDTLYFDSPDTLRSQGFSPDAAGAIRSHRAAGFYISNEGHAVSTARLIDNAPDSLDEKTLLPLLRHAVTANRHRCRLLKSRTDELDYYARTHNVTDDGYNDAMAFREQAHREQAAYDTLQNKLERALRERHLRAVLQADFTLLHCAEEAADSLLFTHQSAHLVRREPHSLLLAADEAQLPQGAERMVSYLLPSGNWDDDGRPSPTVIGIPAFHLDSLYRAQSIPTAFAGYPFAQGAPAVNAYGHVVAMQGGGDGRELHRLIYGYRSYFSWLWRNAMAGIRRWFTDTPAFRRLPAPPRQRATFVQRKGYCGQTARAGKRHGAGTQHYTDGARYDGEWRNDRREGYGSFEAADGTRYEGRWHADTLAKGTRRDTTSLYEGQFDRRLQRNGKGTYRQRRLLTFYDGEWQNDRRHGFGLYVAPHQTVNCGIWQNDRFRGERMAYTADRVYGIDISRYQHEIGKKKYGIDWKRLRVAYLGPHGGHVNFPVSYIYIKATQGTTIRSRYYATDARQARAHGFPVGAYHFFSTKSGQAQARFFLQNAAPAKGDLPPMLDLEPTEKQIAEMGGRAALFREVLTWLRLVEARCGVKPLLYVGQLFVNQHLAHAPEALRNYPVWVARYGEYRPYIRLHFWQLTPYGRIAGIRGEVDINVFNGTKAHFHEWRTQHAVK